MGDLKIQGDGQFFGANDDATASSDFASEMKLPSVCSVACIQESETSAVEVESAECAEVRGTEQKLRPTKCDGDCDGDLTQCNLVCAETFKKDVEIEPTPVEVVDNTGIPQTLSMDHTSEFMKPRNGSTALPNGQVGSSLNHPAYRAVISELAHTKEEIAVRNSEIKRLQEEKQRLEESCSSDIYVLQLESLEKTIVRQQLQVDDLRKQLDAAGSSQATALRELEGKLDKASKELEAERREKESMVMRYAVSEKEVLDLRKERDTWQRKMKESSRDRDLLVVKLKTAAADKSRVVQLLDAKMQELSTVQKERDKLLDDLSSSNIKIKWLQNKLHSEMEAHKEAQAGANKVASKLAQLREECDEVRRDCQAAVRDLQLSQDNKANTLDKQLKEQHALLIMERQRREDKEELLGQLQVELDNLRSKHQQLIQENNSLSLKVQSLERDRLEYEEKLSRLKSASDGQSQELADLQARLTEMESLRIQLHCEQEKVSASQGEVERLRQNSAELQQDMADCREREADLLHFTQQLTDKNVRLQSEFSSTEARAQQLEAELACARQEAAELHAQVASAASQLQQQRQLRQEETQLLARHLADSTQHSDSLARQLEDQRGENAVLRRKQAAALKELTRELQQCRRRLQQFEEAAAGATSLIGDKSRTSSCSSLNTADNTTTVTPAQDSVPVAAPQEELLTDRQVLLDHIVKLQRCNARRCEKIDFLEEHVRQLVLEVQRKTRIIQSYVLREQSGALSSDNMDRHKTMKGERYKSKADVAKHGGIMASVYSSKPVDSSMTLELSLEINKKLQAVLEDTLLKNITLKENIETLGSEIARLTVGKVPVDRL